MLACSWMLEGPGVVFVTGEGAECEGESVEVEGGDGENEAVCVCVLAGQPFGSSWAVVFKRLGSNTKRSNISIVWDGSGQR